MEKQTGILIIVGACLLVLFMVTVKKKTEILFNFSLRADLGVRDIYGINLALEGFGIPCAVGINLLSLLTSGTFGFSGVSLLYAVAAFAFL